MPIESTPPQTLQINFSAAFLKQLKRLSRKYRRIEHDLRPMLEKLQDGQTPGDQIQGIGHTIYKVRIVNSDARRGIRGGYRVIYYVQAATSRLLLAIYSKSEQSDIPADSIKRIIEEELAH